jgi:XTP/dITP diphosphohydrolase
MAFKHMKIFVATSNLGKLRDFQAIAAGTDVELNLLPRQALDPAPIETGSTFEENARLKAIEYSKRVPGAFVLADDSGLEVDALNGAPGVHSARYAALKDANADPHTNSPDAANNTRLLRELADAPDNQRTARFACVLALARDGEVVTIARGAVEGKILHKLRGTGGFGYDPLFLVAELGITFAEISPGQKGIYSHRGRAFRTLLNNLPR